MIKQDLVKKLEFDKLLQKIMDYMPSEVVREEFRKLGFAENETELRSRHDKLSAFMSFLIKNSNVPSGPIRDIKEIVVRLAKGGVLDIYSLLVLMDNLRTQRVLKNYLKAAHDYPIILSYEKDIIDLHHIEKRLDTIIEDGETLKDTASSELLKIRRNIETKESKIRERIKQISVDKRAYLQDELVTIRNDRYVLPVRSEHRKKIPGMIHDKSSTGSTLFIEPIELIELNNDIKNLLIKESEEVKRIIREVCDYIRDYSHDIIASQEATNTVYMFLSIAKYSLDTGSSIAETKDTIHMIEARHPFIDKKEVVPIDMKFGNKERVLVITGPNTGGKTVTLKTIGLFSLMHRYGLALPLKSGSSMRFFDKVFVDIGDEQSIEQSLSTFSSHMKNIIYILDHADEKSLVLLDEIGAGTDPTEGAAIAMAVLSRLKDKKAFIFSTSHYSQVKEYALSNDGYLNASVEFDINKLAPTYRLIMGVPGKSNAIEIAKRLGLDDETVKRSIKMLDSTDRDLEGVIEELQKQILDNKKKVDEADEILRKANKVSEKYNKKLERLKEREETIIAKAKEEASELYKSKENEIKEIVKELRQMGSSGVDFSKMEALNSKFLDNKNELKVSAKKKNKKTPTSLNINDTVYVAELDTTAIVKSKPDKKGNFNASMGIMDTVLNIKDVELTDKKEEESVAINYSHTPKSFTNKLDIRGYDTESARLEVDRFLDRCAYSNITKAEIIHGKGTGVLRKYIVDYLKKHSHVKSQRFGGYYEGGNGVTIVEVK